MNEFLADYTPVSHGGIDYYRLPRRSPDRLRIHLARGPQTGDREVGVFAAHGLTAVQPYAWAVSQLLALPEPVSKPQPMTALARGTLPAAVLQRPELRAQIGGRNAETGVPGPVAPRRHRPAEPRRPLPTNPEHPITAGAAQHRSAAFTSPSPHPESLRKALMSPSPAETAASIEAFIRRAASVADDDPGFSRKVNLFDAGYLDSLTVVALTVHIEEALSTPISTAISSIPDSPRSTPWPNS